MAWIAIPAPIDRDSRGSAWSPHGSGCPDGLPTTLRLGRGDIFLLTANDRKL